ncbi:MAG: TonB-dependent receptor [Deltaproteobacteria bacterium]|nr:TonB-dependent receptor [Deltaproteobacteria bacterium]
MSLYRLITPILSFCFLSVIIFSCLPMGAQTQDEMIVLSLFYEEKDLVVTPTRYPKPISQVAENISVITEREIEAMNAHTVAEVLSRVPGLYVGFNQDFGASSLLYIQGSEQRHVLVLVDGIPWNFLSEGGAETNSIPVGTIDRIEIVKGPASSAWGSSLGGVVNILTKPTGDRQRPTGSIRASYGEKNSQDYRAQVSGMAGPVGYYLFAGRQDSKGLRDARYFDNYSLYGKFHLPVSDYVEADLSMGYSRPDIKLGEFPARDFNATASLHSFFVAASIEAFLARGLSLKVSYHTLKQKSQHMNDVLGLGMIPDPPGELFLESIFDEETTGGSAKLVWEKGRHTAVLGVDFDQGRLDQTLNAGSYLQDYWGVPASSATHPEIDQRAVYANDTILIGEWSLTPGIRVDDNSITGSFVSPSLGLTRKWGKESLFRASAARGFTIPPLSSSSGGGLFLDPNPALDPEEVWSFQAGIESGALKYLWARATLFRHDLDNALILEPYGGGPPAYNDLIINDGEVRRQGLELEFQTLPFHHFSLQAGFSYVDISPSAESGAEEPYAWNIGLRYDDKASFRAELFGRFVKWDVAPVYNASYDDFIWELNLNKKILSGKTMNTEVFLTAHNLFDGEQFVGEDHRNPETWIEAGIRLLF